METKGPTFRFQGFSVLPSTILYVDDSLDWRKDSGKGIVYFAPRAENEVFPNLKRLRLNNPFGRSVNAIFHHTTQ
jgi:hypothetical protein